MLELANTVDKMKMVQIGQHIDEPHFLMLEHSGQAPGPAQLLGYRLFLVSFIWLHMYFLSLVSLFVRFAILHLLFFSPLVVVIFLRSTLATRGFRAAHFGSLMAGGWSTSSEAARNLWDNTDFDLPFWIDLDPFHSIIFKPIRANISYYMYMWLRATAHRKCQLKWLRKLVRVLQTTELSIYILEEAYWSNWFIGGTLCQKSADVRSHMHCPHHLSFHRINFSISLSPNDFIKCFLIYSFFFYLKTNLLKQILAMLSARRSGKNHNLQWLTHALLSAGAAMFSCLIQIYPLHCRSPIFLGGKLYLELEWHGFLSLIYIPSDTTTLQRHNLYIVSMSNFFYFSLIHREKNLIS